MTWGSSKKKVAHSGQPVNPIRKMHGHAPKEIYPHHEPKTKFHHVTKSGHNSKIK